MKKKLLFLLSMILLGASNVACSDNEINSIPAQAKHPLTSFAVQVGDSYYHGKIDQSTHRVEIGSIENTHVITGVNYALMNDAATISPDPATFVGKWKNEQTVTVTTEDNTTTAYTIVFTKFNKPIEEVLFMDDFSVDGEPDGSKWSLCKKSSADWSDEMSESFDQAYVKDDNLVLVAEKVNGVYKAGGLATNNKFAFTYGKVEVRARISKYPNGAFPAIWMMPQKAAYNGWPDCGEIDIMEHIKQEPHIHHTIHTNYTYDLGIKDPSNNQKVVCNFGEYNLYTVEWTEDAITFFVNGKKTFSYPNLRLADEAEKMQWPFNKDSSFYLILNMGLGGNGEGSWAGPIDDSNLPAIMEVDWIKVTRLPDTVTPKAVIGYITLNDHEFDKQFPTIEWEYLTHVNASFARVKADGSLNIDPVKANIQKVRDVAHQHNVKVLIALAQNTKGEFSDAIANPTTRTKLVNEIIKYTRDNNLDGVDIDYEEHDNTSDNTNYQSLLAFVKELNAAKDKSMLMTCAVYGRWLYYGPEWGQYFDYINIMSYDGNNVFSATSPVQHASFEDFEKDLANWSEKLKTPKSKIIGGLPFYGYSWDKNLPVDSSKGIRYNAIVQHFGSEAAAVDVMGGETYYNGQNTIRKKCKFVKDNNYGGVMIWQLLQDAYSENQSLRLIKAVGESIN